MLDITGMRTSHIRNRERTVGMLDITGVRTSHIHNRESRYVGYYRFEN